MLLDFLSLFATCLAAVTGALAAGRKQMDFFGVIVIAVISGLGGGTVRDILTNNYPLGWVNNPHYVVLTAACAIVTIIIGKYLTPKISRLFLYFDALGLATFVVVGCQKVAPLSLHPLIIVICGMITGICGGMLRDILCNDIPLVLRKELYATVALCGAVLYLSLDYLQVHQAISVFISIVFMFVVRVWAITYSIEMPKFHYRHE